MNSTNGFQRSVSILMIFILMIQISGCSSYRIVSNSDISDYSRYNHLILGKRSEYHIENVSVTQELLSGKINLSPSGKKNLIRVYAKSDSIIKIDADKTLRLPLNDIAQVRVPQNYIPIEYNPSGTSKKKSRKEPQPAGKVILNTLYVVAGFAVFGTLSWMIFEKKRH